MERDSYLDGIRSAWLGEQFGEVAVAPESDVAAVQFLVRHEQALLTFVDREIGGDPAHALEAVEKLLQ